MPKKCLICKVEPSPACVRSFHLFPKNECMRQNWIDALNISKMPNFKTTYICSDHFDSESFCYSYFDELRQKKRLYKEAVPKQISLIQSIDSKENDEPNNINLQSSTEKVTETSTEELPLNDSEMLSCNTPSNETNSKKRKQSFNNIRIAKKLRFMTGFKVEYLYRQDFVSEEAWNRFLRFLAYKKSKTVTAYNKNSRKQKKIQNLTGLIHTLEKRDEFEAAVYLKDLPPHVKELLARMKDKKSTAPYPANLKTFARTLHFHSPAAYEVVRRSFLKCLPCVQTLNSWTCAKEYKPGISDKTINNVSDIVNQESAKGKKLVFNLTFDEMSIKQHKEWDRNTHSWKGLVDLGGQLNELDAYVEHKMATKSLVFMLVNINGGFKVPVAHYLIHSLTGVEKSILLKDLLIKLNEKKIDVVSVTFDGDRAHRTACESLGANLNYRDKDNFKPYFEHPGSLKPVYIFYDPCHCLKLIRNYFATKGPIIYDGQEYIHWGFIKKLQKVQESARLHLACKISNRHVDFYKEKMKVYLAAQVLSRSVSIALNLLEFTYKDEDFKNASSTANFCQIINDIFDLLNVRSKFCKTTTRTSINKTNLKEVENKINKYIQYIEKLEINNKTRKTKSIDTENTEINKNSTNTNSEVTVRKSVLQSDSVSTGFLGFIICLKNLYSLSKNLIQNNVIEYLLSYKLSQDHIEMFFSSIRRMNGFNNNPTTTQYNSAYKKLLLNKLDIITSSSANCTPFDQTLLLSEDISIIDEYCTMHAESLKNNDQKVSFIKKERVTLSNITNVQSIYNNDECSKLSKTRVNYTIKVGDFLQNENYHMFEHCYNKTENEGWSFSEYSEDIVKHTAGAIARFLTSKIHCDKCRDLLLDTTNSTNKSKLTEAKNYRGLKYASYDVNFICKCTERMIRKQKYLIKKNVNDQLITETLKILPRSILDDDKHFLEQELFMDHRYQLILLIIQKYIDIRLKHESKILQNQNQRIRMLYNKLTIFKGQ